MGVPDTCLISLFDKFKSWISWDRGGFSSRSVDFDMAKNKICCECERQFTKFCPKFNCSCCGRWLCGSCIGKNSSLIILANADSVENAIKSCKFCLNASKRYADKIYPSESPRGSSESPSPCSVEEGDRKVSSKTLSNSSSFSSFAVCTSSISAQCSPTRSDEESDDCGKHFLSPSSDYYYDISDVDTSSLSFRHKQYSIRSVGSSPSGSPSRINVDLTRINHSVDHNNVRKLNSRNEGPFSREMSSLLVKPDNGTILRDEIFKKQLYFENIDSIWFPPPPEDEDDDSESIFFEYDDEDDEIGDSGGMFSSTSGIDSLFPSKEKHSQQQKEPLKLLIQSHFRALVSQLLQGEGVEFANENESGDWLVIISNLAWQAANFVKPDTSKGGSMDPGAYVKIKCVASGRPDQSALIKGVVFTKNIRHKRMTSQYKNPRLLLLGGSLEYQRAPSDLASFNTLVEEERNHLKIILSRIEAHRPNVLLVERSVSPYAQEYLLTKEISLVLNVKRHLLERIAQCTGASVTSVDSISLSCLGHCELFHVEKVAEELEGNNQVNKRPSKTLMFFQGCPRRLGCTILLKGLRRDELKKLKRVVQYAVFAAYHLSSETSFLSDEGASLPNITLQPLTQPMVDMTGQSSQCMKDGELVSSAESSLFASAFIPIDDRTDDASDERLESQLSVTAGDSGSLRQHDYNLGLSGSPGNILNNLQAKSPEATLPVEQHPKEPEMASEQVSNEYFSAADSHQNILVSFSSSCVMKGIVCERSRLLRIKFYGSSDKPLGKYLRDDLLNPASHCRSCKEPVEAHVQSYTHQQGSLTIKVRCLSSHKLPGQQDGKIWMWHRCLLCLHKDGVPPATRRVVMSDAAWGLSFGKFLELSFSNHTTANRIASCGHSLQRDCLRFYGCGNMVAFFRYTPIDILSVRLPPSVLEFNGHRKREWLRTEVAELKSKMETLYAEITDVLDFMEQKITSLHKGTSNSRDLNEEMIAMKDLLTKERNDYYVLVQQDSGDSSSQNDGVNILELNGLRHSLSIRAYVWEYRFCYLNSQLRSWSSSEALQDASLHSELRVDFSSNETKSDISEVKESTSSFHLPVETTESSELNTSDNYNVSSTLSDKIDSAWTGLDSHCGTSQVSLVNNLPRKRLMSPARVYSFDSAMRLRERLHKASQPSPLHLSSVRSFHVSGDYRSMIGDPISSILRSNPQISPREAKTLNSILRSPPTYISCASHMAEGARLLLPKTGRNNLAIAVFDDEPTSIISYALASKEHEDWICSKLNDLEGSSSFNDMSGEELTASSISHWPSFGSVDLDYMSYGSEDVSPKIGSLFYSSKKSPHLRVSFEDDSAGAVGKAKFSVTCYFAKQFDMLRRKCCPNEVDFVSSLSRCKKWIAQGGKSNVYFAKSLDDRFIIKQVTKTELDSFEEFAPEYFRYLTDSLNSGSPTCLAKVLGIYQVSVKNLRGGKETKMDLIVMENIFFERTISRVYDLKGSSRSRYNPDTTGENKVLLDMNLLEALRTNPIFLGSKAKRILERAVWNDTSFLACVDVMDYSLLVGVDEERKELVLGIIDYMRQYTWDKHLETWVKASGILGGPKNASPTIVSPKQYKLRFRKAMTAYFLTVPDQWSS